MPFKIKTLSMTLPVREHDEKPLQVEITQAFFPPRSLIPKLVPELTAHQHLQRLGVQKKPLVFGGIYFRRETGSQRKIPDGFLYFNPEKKRGETLSTVARFQHGGFLLFDHKGRGVVVRRSNLSFVTNTEGSKICVQDDSSKEKCDLLEAFRLIVQSNVILVFGGKEDNNTTQDSAMRAALGLLKSGEATYVATNTRITLKAFGDLLVEMGVVAAINLDGHTSVQLAEKRSDKTIKNWFDHQSEPMPLLFEVSE